MFRDFGSALRVRAFGGERRRTRRAAGIARQDADMDLSGAPPGHHPAWRAGLVGRKRLHLGLRIERRQNRLDRHRSRRRRVLPDPNTTPSTGLQPKCASEARQRGYEWGVVLCRTPDSRLGLSFIQPLHREGSASSAGFRGGASNLLTGSRFGRWPVDQWRLLRPDKAGAERATAHQSPKSI
jgi:hypothetical protein